MPYRLATQPDKATRLRSKEKSTVMWNCLIIEDDRENAQYIADGFRELGHWPVICHDGVEGLHRASTESWDLIILDRMLPNQVDGLSILTKLRAVGSRPPCLCSVRSLRLMSA